MVLEFKVEGVSIPSPGLWGAKPVLPLGLGVHCFIWDNCFHQGRFSHEGILHILQKQWQNANTPGLLLAKLMLSYGKQHSLP